jgi:glutathione S-transferase
MSMGRLLIGNRRYSSWSLRGWLLVRLAGLEVTETLIPLSEGATQALADATPTGLVPYLEHDGARIWESLSIAEYAAEHNPALWPADRVARAHARSISAEMHAGFRALRQAMPMNLCRSFPGRGRTPEVLADIARIETIWSETGSEGPFLYGANFGAADAMFAPVVARFLTYGVELSEPAASYCAAVRAHPLVDEWYRGAAEEPAAWLLEKYET